MAKSVNRVTLLGNLGRDPEFKVSSRGVPTANINMAISSRVKQGEEWKDRTDWFYVTFYGKLAEIVRDYVKKGHRLYVEARLRADSWDDNGTTRYRTAIVGEEITLLGASAGSSGGNNHSGYDSGPITDDDIPF